MVGLPLEGVRILSVEQYGAGPFGSLYLADMGAEVIKIEPPARDGQPGGDMARQTGPHLLPGNDSQFFQTFNRNKRSMTLDLKHPEGQAVLRALAATADAVMNNLRGDQPERLGLTHAALGRVKPALVCAHLSAYGRSGPRAGWPGYDYLMQAEAGYMSLTGEPGTPPARMGLSIVDYMTGVTCALALVSALLAAARTGQGRDVDVSLYDVAMHQLSYPATWYLNTGEITGRRPRSGHPSIVPVEMLPTRDGWVFVMCVLPKFWERLCAALGVPELVSDPRFLGPRERRANRDALMEILDARSRTRTTAEWMAVFGGQVPAAPVHDIAQALDNPFFRERGGVQRVDHPHLPGLAMVASPIRAGAEPPARPAPALGADTEALLAEIGMADRLEALRAAGVV
ncbi:MAG: CoA transferase [Paracoccaceae bacterium]|nr:MAG: CoA transferase [Paracoccaceae bacterium]